ncbi:MAG: sensor histidine kinase [Aeromicrobium sp.]
MRWGSVRTRTTVLAILVVGTTLAAGAILLVITLGQSLSKSGDGLAKSRARDLAGLAEAGALPKVLSKIDGEGIAQVVDASGRVLAATPSIKDEEAISTLRPPGEKPVVVTITNAPGDDAIEDYRVWALSANTDDGPVSIYVGKSLETVEEATRTLRNSFTVAVPSALALLALGTWLVIGRALRPVEQIREELTTITDEDLDRRVPVPPSDDEVARLAKTMNMVLDRLEIASRKQREFVGDASHELQSPLTAIRVQLEVAIAHPEEADWRTLATNVLNDSGQMERLVHDLLYLAREHDQATPASEAVDLDDIVLQEAARTRTTTTILIDTAAVSGAPVSGSRDDLRRLVRNLIENAVHHAVKTVCLTVSCDEQHARVGVEDDGPGVPPEMQDRVFDRFYRTDASRSRHAGGTGLGLAIARAIAERHGGRLELVDSDSGAHFVVTLPIDGSEPRTSGC